MPKPKDSERQTMAHAIGSSKPGPSKPEVIGAAKDETDITIARIDAGLSFKNVVGNFVENIDDLLKLETEGQSFKPSEQAPKKTMTLQYVFEKITDPEYKGKALNDNQTRRAAELYAAGVYDDAVVCGINEFIADEQKNGVPEEEVVKFVQDFLPR